MSVGRESWRAPGWRALVYSTITILVLVDWLFVGYSCSYKRGPSPIPTLPPFPRVYTCADASIAPNPIAVENTCPGSDGWKQDEPAGSANAIEGFTSAVSVNAGESLNLYVSTTAATYQYVIYRMGWYQGHGGRLMYTSPSYTGVNQPAPIIDPVTHLVSCGNWTGPVTVQTQPAWVSGVYIIKLKSSDGFMRYAPFVVRNDASRSPILFTSSVITYQAYNLWGGYDLYRGLDAQGASVVQERSLVVSFDRPYDQHLGLADFGSFEIGLLRWLEHAGTNLSYSTDVDSDLRGDLLLRHRLIIVAGHDEYWSTDMRRNITYARDHLVSLAFFGANDSYWHIRMSASPLGSDREVICYKHGYQDDGARDTNDPVAATDPAEATVLWRDLTGAEAENSLLGAMYHGSVPALGDMTLAQGANPLLSQTGLQVGSVITGIVGNEFDSVFTNGETPAGLSVLAASQVRCNPSPYCPASGEDVANATLYTASSGARVFDAGTFYWERALDPGLNPADAPFVNVGFQRLTTNLLIYLLTPAPTA